MRTLILTLIVATTGSAAVKTEAIKYKAGDVECIGYLAWDDTTSEKRPGVLVFPEWWGLTDDTKKRAEMLAKAGYVALAADLYGGGKVAEHSPDAAKFMNEVRKNQSEWLARARAAMTTLQAQKTVEGTKLAAIGYCFGGTTALALAFDGADLKAVASFHGGLPDVTAEQAGKAKCTIQMHHGGADTFIPDEAVKKFRAALDSANVRYEWNTYAGATHGFTVVGVEKRMPMLKYDADADKKSWEALEKLFKDTLR